MIVVDASILVEVILAETGGPATLRLEREEAVWAPELIDLEVLSTLRRLLGRRQLPPPSATSALDMLATMPIERAGHGPLLPRIWELRDNLTPYDASYVALAEALDAPLVTLDQRIARAPGIHCPVEVLG